MLPTGETKVLPPACLPRALGGSPCLPSQPLGAAASLGSPAPSTFRAVGVFPPLSDQSSERFSLLRTPVVRLGSFK